MLPSRSLIINADDFGYNNAITQGILKGYREGLITSTSAMINIDGAPERIAAAHTAEPALPIGLHLNLTAGKPVLTPQQVPHLVRKDGTFYPFQEILLRFSEIPLDEVRAEMRAQAERLQSAGVTFDHIDYHQQILALYSPFFDIVAELACEYHVPVRQPSLAPIRGRSKTGSRGSLRSLGLILGFMARAFLHHPIRVLRLFTQIHPARRKQIAAGLGTTDWFVGAFFADPTLENFSAILHQLPPGLSEMMCHPALESPELYSMPEDYRSERSRELAVLLDPRARAEVDRRAIRLTDFSSAKTQTHRQS